MWYQFIFENLHFAINLSLSLVFFAAFWLHFDAWIGRKTVKEFVRVIGYLLLSLSFIVTAGHIETTILPATPIKIDLYNIFLFLTRFFGYVSLIGSYLLDPLVPKPNQNTETSHAFIPVWISIPFFTIAAFAYPILASTIAFLSLKRSTLGLENHLKPIALAFFLLAISELLSLGFLLQNTTNSNIYAIVAPFGVLWILQNIILAVAAAVTAKWVFGYLLKRFQSQLFILFTSMIVVVFVITTIAFTALLLHNLESDKLKHLESDVHILAYTIDSKKAEILSDAQVVSYNPEVQKAIVDGDKKGLKILVTSLLIAKKQAILTVVSKDGVVLARGDNPDKIGDSLSSDPLVKKALRGSSASNVITRDSVVAPIVSIRSASPIKVGNTIVGAVIVGTDIDNTFVDGVKKATKLDSSIYADDIRSATTYISPDGKSRWIGIGEQNGVVKSEVLNKGKSYSGVVNILNTNYLAAYEPLKDINNVTVGMLFVGVPQTNLLVSAGRSIELTFLVSTILLMFSVIPAFIMSKYLASQIK